MHMLSFAFFLFSHELSEGMKAFLCVSISCAGVFTVNEATKIFPAFVVVDIG